MVAAYLPTIIAINIAAYAYISSADKFYIKKEEAFYSGHWCHHNLMQF